MSKPDYTDHFAAPAATGSVALWRLILGTALVLIVLPELFIIALTGNAPPPDAPVAEFSAQAQLAVPLLVSAFSWVWLSMVLALLHGQPLRSVLAPNGRIWPRDLVLGMQIALVYLAISALLSTVLGGPPARSELPLTDWIAWMPMIGLLVIVQASGEEAVFRGYLLQQIALRTRNRAVLIVITSALFGLLHYDPGLSPGDTMLFVLMFFGFGALSCLLVIRTGSLSAAIGFHIANNWVALFLFGTEIPGRGATQIWIFDSTELSQLIVADIMALGLTWIWLQSPISPLLPAAREA